MVSLSEKTGKTSWLGLVRFQETKGSIQSALVQLSVLQVSPFWVWFPSWFLRIRLFRGLSGRGALSSNERHLFPLLSGGCTSPRCLFTQDWLGLAAHHGSSLLSLCAGENFPRGFQSPHHGFRFLCLLFTWAFQSFWTLSALAVYLCDQVRLLRRGSFRLRRLVAYGTDYHKLQRQPPGSLHRFFKWRLKCAQVFCIQRCSCRLMSGVSLGSVNIL